MSANPHGEATCRPPNASSRRWQNTLWICPDCGKGYTSRLTVRVPGRPLTAWQGGPVWSWWEWPKGEDW